MVRGETKARMRFLTILFLTIAIGMLALSQPNAQGASQSTAQKLDTSAVSPAAPNGTYFDHIVVIVMENEGINDICGRSPPPCNGSNSSYTSSLANGYGIASHYVSLITASPPNYVGLLGASTFGCTVSGCPPITSPNLVDRFEASGLDWKGYLENQGLNSGCATNSSPNYTPRHNPFTYFQDITNNTARCNKLVLANPSSCTVTDCTLINDLNSSSAPNFMWLTPNLCNDMHGNDICSNGCIIGGSTACISEGDHYLSGLIPNILNSQTFTTTRSALFITYDEGNGFCPINGTSEDCLYAVWAGPEIKTGFVSNNPYDQYSFTKTLEVNWNLTSLTSNDANATPMIEFFNTPPTPPPVDPPGVYFDHLVFIMMENEGIADICGGSPPPCSGGSNTPYTAALANQYGIDKQYLRVGAGTSQPQYIAIMAASQMNCTSGCGTSGNLHALNLVDRFESAGLTWKAYMEDQGVAAGCVSGDIGFYAAIHNPFVSFNNIFTNSARCNNIVLANPSGCGSTTDCALINDLNSGSAPNFMWLTPNNCDNMHAQSGCPNGCTSAFSSTCLKAGDNYLKSVANNILNSTTFKTSNSALFITFDEGNGFCPGPFPSSEDCLYNVWSGPAARTAYSNSTLFNHYSFTKTIETNWGLSAMTSNDATAIPMTSFLKPHTSPDFSISASSPAPTNAGQSGTSTIAVTALNGFSGTVSLTDTIPSGLTCGSISPGTITGSGTATVSCSATSAGNYTLTVTGTSGSLVHTTTLLFQFRDFTIAAGSVNVNAGASGVSTITVTAINRFAGTVNLTDNVPSGLVCGSITLGSVTGSGTATVSCSATVPANYTLTITGTSSSLVHTATPIFHIQDFGIAASSLAPVNAGSSVTSTITINSINHFLGVVSLTDTVPSGLTCGAITPSSITGSGTATVSCSATAAGNYTLTLTGTTGSLVHTATALFQYRDFTVSAGSPSPVNAGSSAITTVTVNSINQFGGTVSLTDTVPSGLACGSVTPSSITGSGSATISCTSTIAGNYTLTVTGTSGSLVHPNTALFQFRDFTTSAATPQPVDSTQSATSTITITPLNHFNGVVNLTDTVPVGLTCGAITPTSITGSGTATVSCSASVTGNYTLTISGSSGSLLHSATVLLRFQDFTITATSPAAVNAGQSPTSTGTVAAGNGFTGTVTFTITTPPGLTCGSFNPTSIIASGSVTISCSATVAGNYTATITGTSTPLIHNATATFQFRDFTIAATSPAPVNAGNATTSTITVAALNHFAGAVALTDTVPSGLSCGTITPNSVTGSGTATVSCSATGAGNYTLTITGSSGSLVHTATAIFRFQDFTMSASSPAPANAGSPATSTVTVTAVNGFAGTVSFSDIVPSGLACGAVTPASITGSGAATVSCSAPVAGSYALTVTGTSGSLVHTDTATFSFVDFTIAASSPAAVNVGQSATSTITISAVNGFTGAVTLTDTVPAGLTCGLITPGSVTGSGTATVLCSATVVGNYTLTLTGTSGILVHSATALFQFRDFTITTSSLVTANVGASSTSTLTVSALNHFSGTVLLSDTVPAGLTCGVISPVSVTGSGTATVSCSASLAGNYTLILTGTSSQLVHTATTLFQFWDFSSSASSPAPLNAGSSATSNITITPANHFNGVVSLTDTVPTGLVCGAISPTSITGSGTATVSCNASVAGNYTLTITAISNSLVHNATALFQFQDFGILASTPAPINAGSSATSTITISSVNHFAGTVSLTDITPSGLTCGAISPTSLVGSGSSTVSCNAPAAGNYTLTVMGTSGSLNHSATALFRVQDFSMSATSPIAVTVGVSATSTITITALNAFAGTISLTDTIPTNLTCGAITPASITNAGTATVSCSSTVAATYALTITGTIGNLSHSTSVTVIVTDFTISATSPPAVQASTSATSTITVTAVNGFTGTVAFTDVVPANLTCGALTPTSIINSGTATLACSSTIAANYVVTITGTNGTLSHSATATFSVTDFTMAATSPAAVAVGTSATSTITVTAVNGFAGVVNFNDNIPTGLTCNSINPGSVTSSGTAVVSCTSNLAGNYTLTVTGTSGALSHSATVLFSVQDYAITASPSTSAINAGSTGSSIITIIPLNIFSGTVSLSLSGTTGLTSMINPMTIPGGSGPATLTFSATAAGNYTITINSSSGTLTHTITVSVQVVDFAISVSPVTMTLLAGATGNSTVTITGLNGFVATVGLTVTPSTGLIAATVPSIIPGSGSSTLTVSAPVYGNYSVTIQASSGSLSHVIGITIHVVDYRIDATPVNLVDPVGSNTSSTLTLHSLNGYAGNVNLSFTVQADSATSVTGGSLGGPHPLLFAPPAVLPTVSVNPQSSHLSPGGTELSIVSVSFPSNLPVGTYRIIMTADDGTLSHTIVLTIVATDFSITATPTSVSISTGSNATINLNLESLSFFQGNVNLTITSTQGGPTGILSTSIFQLTFYSRMNLNLTIEVPSNTPIGNYTITIQAASGTVTHTLNFAVRVTTGGLLSMLARILSRQNSASISAIAIFSLLAIFATLNVRRFPRQKSIFRPRRDKNHFSERSTISWYASYPLVPSLVRADSKDMS